MDKKEIDNILKWENEKNIIISASKIGNIHNFNEFYDCCINANNINDIKKCKSILELIIKKEELNKHKKEEKEEKLRKICKIIDKIKSDEELENFKEFVELLKFYNNDYGIYLNEWINKVLEINRDNVADVMRYAKILAIEFSAIPSTKLRKFYDYVLKVYENYENKKDTWYVDLYRLKSFIAYNIGRETGNKKKALEKFSKVFEKLIDKIDGDEKKFTNFKKFFEAVVAYHRAYNEK